MNVYRVCCVEEKDLITGFHVQASRQPLTSHDFREAIWTQPEPASLGDSQRTLLPSPPFPRLFALLLRPCKLMHDLSCTSIVSCADHVSQRASSSIFPTGTTVHPPTPLVTSSDQAPVLSTSYQRRALRGLWVGLCGLQDS